MRVLFASTSWLGHFLPLVPFIEAFRRRGAEVLIAGPDDLRDTVAEAGYPFRRFDSPPREELERIWAPVAARSPDEQNVVAAREIFAGALARASVPGLLETIAEWRPDAVVREAGEFGSPVAAESADVPHARVGATLSFIQEVFRPIVAESVDDLRTSVGLPPDPDANWLARSPYLTLFPAVLEVASEPLPAAIYRFRDPFNAVHTPLPDWWDGDDSPLVYVTYGTVTGASDRLAHAYRRSLDAVGDLPVRALLTIGRGGDAAAAVLEPVPANVHVERWVRQPHVLPHTAVVVCHGGSGTMLGALAAGVPLVIVPLFADQHVNARRVAELGAGIAVDPPDAAAIRDGTRRVLDDESFAIAAARVADEMRQLPPTEAALDVVLERTP